MENDIIGDLDEDPLDLQNGSEVALCNCQHSLGIAFLFDKLRADRVQFLFLTLADRLLAAK